MNEQLALLPTYLTAHLQLSLMALLIGTTLSVPLGVWITRRKRLGQLALGVAGVIQTIPSLALLALMVPVLAVLGHFTSSTLGFELRSIGYLPALIALTLYSMLPILQTTVAGIEGVDPALNEAARGVGMTDRQRLLRVQLPLALPVIVAGVRTATVWVIGMTTLSTPVGATSLGNYIFSGLQTRNFAAVCVGSIAAALLAILVDQITRS
ncbi:MAG: ABC transporter permease, partial [Deltaproteobacteria bacterium]|nr:ABC transporter permease [Deltaproteobacteria bacterium]